MRVEVHQKGKRARGARNARQGGKRYGCFEVFGNLSLRREGEDYYTQQQLVVFNDILGRPTVSEGKRYEMQRQALAWVCVRHSAAVSSLERGKKERVNALDRNWEGKKERKR